jgi:hypothetical protein
MNERLKELAVQAGIAVWGDAVYMYDPKDTLDSTVMTKFAELIIAECMNQVREQYKPVLEDEVMMKDTHWDGYVQCGVDSYVAIKEHFGVSND